MNELRIYVLSYCPRLKKKKKHKKTSGVCNQYYTLSNLCICGFVCVCVCVVGCVCVYVCSMVKTSYKNDKPSKEKFRIGSDTQIHCSSILIFFSYKLFYFKVFNTIHTKN
ncbi:hypothetical protein EGW08_010042 [Elysia chlorotica]|uniref:Uncharacterized protein n=1 Tax=Elysia chlorotica TaxID=188477 RepID=A0A3S1B894_ELYCH|nr:hypothetical protein EGW08_010042 [Elysia chlorotica]